MALLWAAGIIWFAYDVAGSEPQDGNASTENATDASGAAVPATDEQKLADALNGF